MSYFNGNTRPFGGSSNQFSGSFGIGDYTGFGGSLGPNAAISGRNNTVPASFQGGAVQPGSYQGLGGSYRSPDGGMPGNYQGLGGSYRSPGGGMFGSYQGLGGSLMPGSYNGNLDRNSFTPGSYQGLGGSLGPNSAVSGGNSTVPASFQGSAVQPGSYQGLGGSYRSPGGEMPGSYQGLGGSLMPGSYQGLGGSLSPRSFKGNLDRNSFTPGSYQGLGNVNGSSVIIGPTVDGGTKSLPPVQTTPTTLAPIELPPKVVRSVERAPPVVQPVPRPAPPVVQAVPRPVQAMPVPISMPAPIPPPMAMPMPAIQAPLPMDTGYMLTGEELREFQMLRRWQAGQRDDDFY